MQVFAAAASFSAPTSRACVDILLNSVYHLAPMLRSSRDVGFAYGPISGDGLQVACVAKYGVSSGRQGQLPADGFVIAYPYDGQEEVPTEFSPASESPNPAPDLMGLTGAPIMASIRNAGIYGASFYRIDKFVLKDELGVEVPARLLIGNVTTTAPTLSFVRDPNAQLEPGEAFLLPLAPLEQGKVYTVEFEASNGITPHAKTWQFTTKGH